MQKVWFNYEVHLFIIVGIKLMEIHVQTRAVRHQIETDKQSQIIPNWRLYRIRVQWKNDAVDS